MWDNCFYLISKVKNSTILKLINFKAREYAHSNGFCKMEKLALFIILIYLASK